jgi:hypothetical protein
MKLGWFTKEAVLEVPERVWLCGRVHRFPWIGGPEVEWQ